MFGITAGRDKCQLSKYRWITYSRVSCFRYAGDIGSIKSRLYVWSKTSLTGSSSSDLPSNTYSLGATAPYHFFDSGYSVTSTTSPYFKNFSATNPTAIVSSTTPQGKNKSGRPEYQGKEAYYSAYVYDSLTAGNITGATFNGGTSKITYTANNSFSVGDNVVISGNSPSAFNYNAGATVTDVTPTTFSVSYPIGSPGTWLSGGSAVANNGWKLLASTSQVFTKDYGWYKDPTKTAAAYGKLVYDPKKSTIEWMLDHLPDLYKANSTGAYNQELKDFLSLFAFHYDTYRTASDLVYGSSKYVDNKILPLLLNELGFN